MSKNSDKRWEKLRAGLYDAIYGRGLDQPYLDATDGLLDELKREHADALRQRDALAVAIKKMMDSHGMHGPCSGNSCGECFSAYELSRAALADLRDEPGEPKP